MDKSLLTQAESFAFDIQLEMQNNLDFTTAFKKHIVKYEFDRSRCQDNSVYFTDNSEAVFTSNNIEVIKH